MSQENRLTVRQAAEIVRVSRDVLYRAIATGELPHVVVGGVKHVDAGDFDAWIESRRTARLRAAAATPFPPQTLHSRVITYPQFRGRVICSSLALALARRRA